MRNKLRRKYCRFAEKKGYGYQELLQTRILDLRHGYGGALRGQREVLYLQPEVSKMESFQLRLRCVTISSAGATFRTTRSVSPPTFLFHMEPV